MVFLTDTHCHLNLPDFSADYDQVVEGAAEHKIRRILVPGISIESSRAAATLRGNNEVELYAAAGIHPNCDQILHQNIKELREVIETNSISAIGEIGLDYYRMKNPKTDQISVFCQLLDLAAEYSLPVCLHNRDAGDDILRILENWISELHDNNSPLITTPGVFHAFSGSADIAKWAISHHFYLGISGVITYKKASDLRQFVAEVDMKHLLIETDAPFLAPHPFRGRRNEPKYVEIVAQEVAAIKGIPFEDVARISSANADTLLGWDEEKNKTIQ